MSNKHLSEMLYTSKIDPLIGILRWVPRVGLLLILSSTYACKSMPKNTESTTANVPLQGVVQEGILLRGNDAQKAIDVITDYALEGANDEGDSKEPTDDTAVSRRISITVKNSATVGQVNSLLNKIRARIIWSAKGSPNIEIRIPESKDPNKAQSTLEFLKTQKDVINFAVIVEE